MIQELLRECPPELRRIKFKKIFKRRKKEHAISKAAEKNVKNLLDYLEVILQKRHF